MKIGDIVSLKRDFKKELKNIGLFNDYSYILSVGFGSDFLEIVNIRHDDKKNIDFAVFTPFLEAPFQCLETKTG